MFFPPGYMSPESLKRALSAKRGHRGGVKIEQLIERGIMICGSPDTVRRRNHRMPQSHRLPGARLHAAVRQAARRLTQKNIRLFASDVMPAIKTLTDQL